jgi:integrase/recombinase XerD
MKLSKAIEGYKFSSLSAGKSPKTMNGYDWAFKRILKYLGDKEVEEITKNDLQRLFKYLHTESGLSSSSIQSVWRTVRSFYNWAVEDLGIDRPDKDLTMPKVDTKEIVPLSEEEIKALLKSCDSTNFSNGVRKKQFAMRRPTSTRDKAVILFLLDSGLRVSEFARLQVKDVNLENGEVIVKPFRTGHKSKSRVVYLGNKTRKILWKYLAEREEIREDDYLFVTMQGYQMNKDNIRQMMEGLGERANIKSIHPHKFRHTFAIQFLRNGGNVFELQRLLGHSSLDMVKRYLQLAQIDLQNAHKRASPVDNWRV